jgi:hypothetical protein
VLPPAILLLKTKGLQAGPVEPGRHLLNVRGFAGAVAVLDQDPAEVRLQMLKQIKQTR